MLRVRSCDSISGSPTVQSVPECRSYIFMIWIMRGAVCIFKGKIHTYAGRVVVATFSYLRLFCVTLHDEDPGAFANSGVHEATLDARSSSLATSHPSGNIEVFLLVGQSSLWVPVSCRLVMSVCSSLAGCGPEKLVKCGPQR
jgi:hypothetical protein